MASSAAFTRSGQFFCASTVSQTVSDLASPPLAPSSFLSSSPHAAMLTNMPATPIAAMSLRFTPPSSGMLQPPPTAKTYAVYCLWGWDLVFNGLDQYPELGLDL